jgi:hypothetical protein
MSGELLWRVSFDGRCCGKSRTLQGSRFSAKTRSSERSLIRYDLNRVTEVACEFCVRPLDPSHLVHESRAQGLAEFWSSAKIDFCNTIGTSRKCGGTVLTAAYPRRTSTPIKCTSKQTQHRPMASPITSAGPSRLRASGHSGPRPW